MSDEEVRAAIACRGTPLRRLRVNAAPTLTPMDEADELIPDVDLDTARVRARRYRTCHEIGARLIGIYTSGWGKAEPSPFPEACLYSGGFVDDGDNWLCGEFHDAPWASRRSIVARMTDPRLRSLAMRLLYSEHRAVLSHEDQTESDRALADRLLNATGGPLTLVAAVEATDKLMLEADADSLMLLSSYRAYLTDRMIRVQAFQDAAQVSSA